MTMVHKPVSTSSASISYGDSENGYFSSIFPRVSLNKSIGIVGNFNILAVSVLISSAVRAAKLVLCHIRKLLTLV